MYFDQYCLTKTKFILDRFFRFCPFLGRKTERIYMARRNHKQWLKGVSSLRLGMEFWLPYLGFYVNDLKIHIAEVLYASLRCQSFKN